MLAPAAESPVAQRRMGERFALGGIVLLAAVIYGWAPGSRVLQPYYASAVHSMSRGLTAFLFAGYDSAGVLSLDKPPMAFWVQTVGVWILGYHWWVIAGVQAAEGLAAVLVLYAGVRRWAGPRTALLAALLLALSPITAAVNRDNVPDALLALVLLLAAYCLLRAVERGRTGWLVAAAALVGVGFLTKMLAAWLVLPALALGYLAAPVSWRKRVGRLLLAVAVTGAVSVSWPVFVSLWPGSRPYVGSTTHDSIWQLTFGYNGFSRVLGGNNGALGPLNALAAQFGGVPGPLRLFGKEVGGQVGWLLPVALVAVLIAAVAWLRGRRGSAVERAGWAMWGAWIVACVGVFSFTGGLFHPYYTAELAPAVCAVTAAAVAVCWRAYRDGRWFGLLLPLTVLGTGGTAVGVLHGFPGPLAVLGTTILALAVLSTVLLLVAFPGWRPTSRRLLVPAAVLGLVAMLLGPAVYAGTTAVTRQDVLAAGDPSAGPVKTAVIKGIQQLLDSPKSNGNPAMAYLRFMEDAYAWHPGQQQVLDYARRDAPDARITLAVEGGTYGTDPFVLNTSARVAALGGYIGLDPTPSVAQLTGWTDRGELRFVLLPKAIIDFGKSGAGALTKGDTGDSTAAIGERIGWLGHHCRPVPPNRIGPDAADAGVLFDCADH